MCAASTRSLEERCLDTANRLISKCKTSIPKIKSITDIDSNLIVLLFEDIVEVNIPDLLCCTSKVEEAHNVQVVIDTLSLDLLGISLSHITGEDVVAGNALAISNLLEVLEGVSLHLASTDQDEASQVRILKRKVCRKRKSSTSFSKLVSSNVTDSSDNDVPDAKVMVKADGSTSNLLHSAIPHHLKKIKKKRPRRASFKVDLALSVNEKPFTSEKPFDSSTKLPDKLTKISGRKKHAPSSNQSNESDSNKILFDVKIKKSQESHPQSKRIEDESKPYFYIEKAVINCDLNKQDELESSKKKIERKTAKLNEAGTNIHPVKKNPEIEDLYEDNLEKKVRLFLEKNSSHKSRASHMKKLHLQMLRKPVKIPPISACRKSFLLPHSLRRRSISRTALKRKSPRKAQFSQNIQKQHDKCLPESSKPGFIHELFEEFPGIQLTPQIVNHITVKYQQHLMKMYNQAKNRLLRKPKTQIQAEKAAKKQSALSNILKKEIQHEQHLKAVKEHKKIENSVKYHLRDARLQSAKMKQYCDEFHTEMRKKMQKRNFTEELIFEKVFMDALKIQQDHVDHLCQEVKESGENDARRHLNYLEALENLYQSQFSLLSKSLTSEKKDAEERIKAEKEVMNSMQREFREELKNEIRFMQRAIIECMEDPHFRELDAEQYTNKLRNRFS